MKVTSELLRAVGLKKFYGETAALRGVNLTVQHGEMLAIMAPSGSGKSTLLHCLAGILVPDLTALENVALSMLLNGVKRDQAFAIAEPWFARLGITGLEKRRAGELPGGHEIVAAVVNCSKAVSYTAPMASCVNLIATALDDQKRKFRFTVNAKIDQYTKVVSADFTLDSAAPQTGVTTKDANGNIYNDYSFTDEVKHKVVAKVNFTTLEGATSKSCEASVTPAALPKCEVPGKENLPPESPECAYCEVPGHETLPKDSPKCAYCTVPGHEDLPKDSPLCANCEVPGHETLPKDSPECAYCTVPGHETLPKDSPDCKEVVTPPTPPTELPHTGAGSIVGLFAGTSAFGAVAHQLVTRRRKS